MAEWPALTLPLESQRRDEEVETRVLAVAVLHCASPCAPLPVRWSDTHLSVN